MAAVVAGIRVGVLGCVLSLPGSRVQAADITNEDCTRLHAVAGPSIRGASINGVLVVEATACRVQLDQLVAHCAGCGGLSSKCGIGDICLLLHKLVLDTDANRLRFG